MLVVITGGTKGIGRACAWLFAEKGYDIALCARTEKDLIALRGEITGKFNVQVFTKVCDVSKKEEVITFGKFCLENMKTVDVLINNAGIFLPGDIYDEEDGLLEQLIETNLYSAYYLTKIIVPEMIKEKRGHVINICSVASINGYDKGGSYGITKHALLGFSKNLRHELKKTGIRVTAVLPGAVFTDSWGETDLPEERFMKAEDIASVIYNAVEISERSVVEEILIRPMLGDI
ncbi:MAG: SDR family NAD(P)-dependent oxidoreductase [Chitinophagales bacterium]|nr:SDR family NAD(P)-dependent oxidoreductase [Chitinophagales bacterium]